MIQRKTAQAVLAAWLLVFAAGFARAQAPAADPYPQIPTFDFGEGDESLKSLQKEITESKPDQHAAIEKKLLAVLETPGAKHNGQLFAFQMLRYVGSPACVPTVSKFLGDEKLSHPARIALYGIKSPAADEALRAAMQKSAGKVRLGLINTLGDRRDNGAVALIAATIGSDDLTTAIAIRALGRIGTRDAAAVLGTVKVGDSAASDLNHARIACARQLARDGQAADARAIYASLFDSKSPSLIRGAALSGIASIDGAKALPALLDAIKSEDKILVQAGAAAIIAMADPAINYELAKQIAALPSSAKVSLLNALVARAQRNGLTEAINGLVSDQSADVRSAAIASLKVLGDASSVPVLTPLLTSKELSKDAVSALRALWADGVAAELIKKAQDGEPEIRAAVIEILGDRRESQALPLVRQCTGVENKTIRLAAIKAMGSLGNAADIETIVTMVVKTKDKGEQDAQGLAIQNAAKRIDDVEGRIAPITKALATAGPEAQVQFIGVLKALGGKNAQAAVSKCLGSSSADVRKAALRGLADWVDDAPLAALKEMAKSTTDDGDRILALRGYIRMIGLPRNRKAADAVAMYKDAIELATRKEEKIQAIGGLGNIKDILAIKAVYACFADAALKTEAMNAAVKIADHIGKKQNAQEIHPILEQIIAQSNNEGIKNRAKSAMEKLSK